MKKNGFTLAEVLVSISVIGVISALTLPNLITNISMAQVGPTLAKAVNTLSNANKAILKDYDCERLTETGLLDDVNSYIDELANYTTLARYDSYNGYTYEDIDSEVKDGAPVISNTGIVYILSPIDNEFSEGKYSAQEDIITRIAIDTNGNKAPNSYGSDIFVFSLLDNGLLLPKGSSFGTDASDSKEAWSQNCPIGAIPEDPTYCAAHIFENNLRVHYKIK